MKQRQRLRMQGYDVNMCKNVIKKDLGRFAFSTTDKDEKETSADNVTLAIAILQRRIKQISQMMYEAREDMLTKELRQAQRQHDYSSVHR